MRVHRERDVLARAEVPVHPLDLVGEHVGRGVLHRGGQVDDDGTAGARVPCGNRGLAALEGHAEFGGAEGFG